MPDDTHDEQFAPDEAGPGYEPTDAGYWREALGSGASAQYLLQDAGVLAAIESGRPHAIYDAFRKQRGNVKSDADRRQLDALLADRRHFVEPVRGSPSLSTINGIGFRPYGKTEVDSQDGTYVKTLFFVFVFLPVFPICSYLVADGEKGGWFFLGKVPMSQKHRWWRRGVIAAAAVAALVIALAFYKGSTHSTVHFVNGLDYPVSITAGEVSATVPPGGTSATEFGEGPVTVEARDAQGNLLERLEVTVPGGTDFVAYNVLGAAPVFHRVVPYFPGEATDEEVAEHETVETLAGESWVVRDDVDDVLEEPPDQVEMRSGQAVKLRRHVGVDDGGWRAAVAWLANGGRVADGGALAARVALAAPQEDEARSIALWYLTNAGDPDRTRAFAESAAAAAPDSIEAQRLYQNVLEEQGRLDVALQQYQTTFEQNRDSPRHGYLYARIASFEKGLPVYERLIPKHPDDPWLRRGAAWVYFQTARFEESLVHYAKLVELQPDMRLQSVSHTARAHVAVGRHDDALREIAELLSAEDLDGNTFYLLMDLYAKVRGLAPDTEHPTVAEQVAAVRESDEEVPEMMAEIAALARDEPAFEAVRPRVSEDESIRYCQLLLRSQSDVESAAQLALGTPDETLGRLDDTSQVAIAYELARLGQMEKARQLLGWLSPIAGRQFQPTAAGTLPTSDELDEDTDIELRAAALVAESRRTDDPAKKSALLEAARRLDVLRVVVPE